MRSDLVGLLFVLFVMVPFLAVFLRLGRVFR